MSTARFDAAHGGTLPARDLASVELWERSLARSRHRRRFAEIGRKARRRRKSVSLALSAALAAGPVLPSGLAAAESSSGTAAAGGMDAGDGLAVSSPSTRVVLELGSHGALVAALQRRLNDVLPFTHLALDGIYGPLTRGAVVNFQRQHNLDATGAVDVRTWASLFNAAVVVMNAGNDAGSGGRSRRAMVGDQVGEREVHLVSHGRNRGNRAVRDRPSHALVVERPEILARPAAAADDQHVRLAPARHARERRHERLGRRLALHGGGHEHDLDAGVAAPDHRHDVVPCRAIGTRDDGHAPWEPGERAFARRVEQAVLLEGRLCLLVRLPPESLDRRRQDVAR